MEDLTLTITAPITEWCSDCNYQASKSLISYSGKCPECGSNHIYSHVKKEKVFSVRVSQGRFAMYLSGAGRVCCGFKNTELKSSRSIVCRA